MKKFLDFFADNGDRISELGLTEQCVVPIGKYTYPVRVSRLIEYKKIERLFEFHLQKNDKRYSDAVCCTGKAPQSAITWYIFVWLTSSGVLMSTICKQGNEIKHTKMPLKNFFLICKKSVQLEAYMCKGDMSVFTPRVLKLEAFVRKEFFIIQKNLAFLIYNMMQLNGREDERKEQWENEKQKDKDRKEEQEVSKDRKKEEEKEK
uniref:Uncharacterized protein n=1 Tax=Romanomermis culicivorax TaxID=13658 RepID=A0A915KG76_ROMCU